MAVTHKWVIYDFDSFDSDEKIMVYGTIEAVDLYIEEQGIEPDLVTTFSKESHMDTWVYSDAKKRGVTTMYNADIIYPKASLKPLDIIIELGKKLERLEQLEDKLDQAAETVDVRAWLLKSSLPSSFVEEMARELAKKYIIVN